MRLDLQSAHIAVDDVEFDLGAERSGVEALRVAVDDAGAVTIRRHVLESELAERIGHAHAVCGAKTAPYDWAVLDHHAGNRLAAISIDYAARDDVALRERRDSYVNVGGLPAAFDLNDPGLRLIGGVRVKRGAIAAACLPPGIVEACGDQIPPRFQSEDSIHAPVVCLPSRIHWVE